AFRGLSRNRARPGHRDDVPGCPGQCGSESECARLQQHFGMLDLPQVLAPAIQGAANAVGPNKRPLSAMTPTIVLKDGKLWLVLGAEGGPTIITSVADILIGVRDYGLDIQEAVNAPRIHQQWLPDRVELEKGLFSPDTIRLLQAAG